MDIQHPLHRRGINHHRFTRLPFDFRLYLRGHQRRHPGRPGHPDIAFLTRKAEDQCLSARPVDQRPLLLLDCQLALLRLIGRQRRTGFQIC